VLRKTLCSSLRRASHFERTVGAAGARLATRTIALADFNIRKSIRENPLKNSPAISLNFVVENGRALLYVRGIGC
jgi:hypothetical protein